MAEVAFIALGSNLGDRDAHLAFAVRELAALPGCRLLKTTVPEETEPFGPPGQGMYLNQMVALETTLAPRELLRALHDIESRAGRERRERWGARTLDLDIVKFGDRVLLEPGLELPHPGIPEREFWQRELAELEAP